MSLSREEADTEIRLCAYCRRPTTQHCSGCYKAPDAEGGHVETVRYCNKTCQELDWKFHRSDCKAARTRRSLYRVAETAKLAFFRLVERNFDLQSLRVEEKGDALVVWQESGDRSLSGPRTAKNLLGDQDKQAVMTCMSRGSLEEYMHVLFEIMMQGEESHCHHRPTVQA